MPEDAREAIGHGVRAKRSKSGAVSFDVLLDAAAQGLRMLRRVRLKCLPRMADFALWAAACESAFRPAGTLETAYPNNRRDAIENMIDADSVAACVRELMTDRAQWTGSASDLLQVGSTRDRDCLRPRGAVRKAHNQDNGHRRERIA